MDILMVMGIFMLIGLTAVGINMIFRERKDWRELKNKSQLPRINGINDSID